MASMVSKLARAAFATRASRSAVGGIAGAARPADAIRVSSAAAGRPKSSEEQKARPKSEVAWAADPSQTRDLGMNLGPAAPNCDSPAGGPKARLYVDENALQSDEAMWAFYERWCKFYGISRTRREMELRFKGFSEGARAAYNASRVGVRKPMSIYADMSKKEASLEFGLRFGLLGTRRE